MKKLDVITCESFVINQQQHRIPDQLLNKLFSFLAKSYHLDNYEDFERLIIQPLENGELTVLYGLYEDVAGLCRTCKHTMELGKKQITTYIAYFFHNHNYKIHPTLNNMGLTQAIQYKLSNPHEELIYIAFANNPLMYKFICQVSDVIYPKPTQKIPNQIIAIIDALKKQHGWITINQHPFIVNSPLVPIRNQTPNFYEEKNELNEFYLDVNPDYIQGNSLLVYLPLHLANISYGLNHLHTTEHIKYSSNSEILNQYVH